jgi:hypothetical protein
VTRNTLGRSATAAVCALLIAVALSACAATPTACGGATDAPIHLIDNTTVMEIAPGTRLDWNTSDGVVLAAHALPADLGDLSWASFAPVAGASSVVAFLAQPGSERSPSAWKQWGDISSIDTGVLLPAVWPGHLGYGSPAEVKSAGGTYSMGIAFIDGAAVASARVVAAYFTTITIDRDGTGAWTFANPAVCGATPGAQARASLVLDRARAGSSPALASARTKA